MRALLPAFAIVFVSVGTATAAPAGVRVERAAPAVVTVGDHVARLSLEYRGAPYVWGGTSPAGFDCSGFTRFVYGRVGIRLPHSSYAQWDSGRHIPRSRLRPGDLVFFAGLSHVGLYLGHDRFIHAPETGSVVSIESLDAGWYAATYAGAVRVHGAARRYPPRRHRRRPRTVGRRQAERR